MMSELDGCQFLARVGTGTITPAPRCHTCCDLQLQRDLNQERATLAQTLSQLETANIKANSLHTDLTTALEESERVKGELDVVKSDCNATKDMLAELSRSYDNDKVAWAGEQAQLKVRLEYIAST